MNQIITPARLQIIQDTIQSDSCSDLESKKNKERIKEFKNLSLKANTIMEHLWSHNSSKKDKTQSSTIFHSQKWGFAPNSQKSQELILKGSCNLGKDNPFSLAKQNYLRQKQTTLTSNSSNKCNDEPVIDFNIDTQKTTFRLLKNGNTKQPRNGSEKKLFEA